MALLDLSSEITPKNVDTVLALLPILFNKKAKLYNIQTEALSLELNCYSKEFDKFIKVLYEENFVISFDWTTWQNEAQHFILYRELLNSADIFT